MICSQLIENVTTNIATGSGPSLESVEAEPRYVLPLTGRFLATYHQFGSMFVIFSKIANVLSCPVLMSMRGHSDI